MRTWIIGAGGLLGSAIARQLPTSFVGSAIPWDDTTGTAEILEADLTRFTRESTDAWAIIWAAGAATTASTQSAMDAERATFEAFIELLKSHLPSGRGAFVLASSAGGIYAGAGNPPFTAQTDPHPTGPYGELKFTQERIATDELSESIPVVLARIANLYGTGQRLDKTQGLISTLVKSAYTREPVNIFVPLDTLRDYIYTDDAARLVLHWTNIAVNRSTHGVTVRVVASGEPNTIGSVIATVGDVTRIRIPVAFGTHASAGAQARDVRLIPDTDATTQMLPTTALPDGIKRVALDLLDRIQQGDALAR